MDTTKSVFLTMFIGYILGFLIGTVFFAFILSNKEQTTAEDYYHLEQTDMNYCPYCGEKLKIETQDKVIL